jgi:hypothetical protein
MMVAVATFSPRMMFKHVLLMSCLPPVTLLNKNIKALLFNIKYQRYQNIVKLKAQWQPFLRQLKR